MDFRFYLFDCNNHIAAADNVLGLSIDDATRVAECLYEGCSDLYGGFELWSGKRRIAAKFGVGQAGSSPPLLSEQLEGSLIALEERLEDCFGCVSRSKQLMARKQSRRFAQVEANVTA